MKNFRKLIAFLKRNPPSSFLDDRVLMGEEASRKDYFGVWVIYTGITTLFIVLLLF